MLNSKANENLLEGLNEEQRIAVQSVQGPLLIMAGPGSGKTRVITHRIAYLVQVMGVSPASILAVTFTNKAAKEMQERVNQLLGSQASNITLGTFHNFGARVLRQYGDILGIDKQFVIYDDDEQKSIVKQSLEEFSLDPKQYSPSAINNAISAAKNKMLRPSEHAAHAKSYFDEIVNRVYVRYEKALFDNHALDFDDLLLKTVLLFQSDQNVLERYQNRYKFLMVDEWQDTNKVQYLMTRMVAGDTNNLCVVGDPNQSIYSWRHADITNILDFENDNEKVKTVNLGRNYRSTGRIVSAAQSVIAPNSNKSDLQLWTDNPEGNQIGVSYNYNEHEEALSVASEIEVLVNQEDLRYGDIAIMYRTNAQSRAPEEAFVRSGIPYRIIGGLRFWERKEVKDLLSYLRVIHNPFDSLSLSRIINVPTRGIGQKTLSLLNGWAQLNDLSLYKTVTDAIGEHSQDNISNLSDINKRSKKQLELFMSMLGRLNSIASESDVLQLFDQLIESIQYKKYIEEQDRSDDRWDNILELRSAISEYQDFAPEVGLSSFLESAALSTDLDQMDDSGPDAVTLITLHQAKGLEFPAVFMIGMEEGLLPHRRSIDSGDAAEIEEERRLCYVGMTRAQERLYMTIATNRSMYGNYNPGLSQTVGPSRFLKDIPSDLISMDGKSSLNKGIDSAVPESSNNISINQSRDRVVKTSPFGAGDHVKHKIFGDGVVVGCLITPLGNDFEVTVAFKGQGVKRLLASISNLEISD
tara:strand:- start:2834 stop:5086 length:2253 start_codon:yes stop_codon:yes gene_type:complete